MQDAYISMMFLLKYSSCKQKKEDTHPVSLYVYGLLKLSGKAFSSLCLISQFSPLASHLAVIHSLYHPDASRVTFIFLLMY